MKTPFIKPDSKGCVPIVRPVTNSIEADNADQEVSSVP